jgi:ATP-dependent RNA/DNA helicase IGHMBP2
MSRNRDDDDLERIVTHFCQQQRQWLESEYSSEPDVNAEALRSLRVAEVTVGLFGRAVIRLVPHRTWLPAHSFSTGDEVEVECSNHSNTSRSGNGNASLSRTRKRRNRPNGVICAVTDTSISVALSSSEETSEDDWNAPPYTLLPRSRVEIHQKLRQAIQNVEDAAVSGGKQKDPCPAQHILPYLFQVPKRAAMLNQSATTEKEALSSFDPQATSSSSTNNALDPSQREAVEFALSPPYPICCIHGPPGTGKTTTVVAWIRRAVLDRGWKLLVAAPSHVAVDQLLSRLQQPPVDPKQPPLRMVRLGHPARVQPHLLAYSLEALVQNADGTAIVQDVRRELQQHFRSTRVNYAEVKRLRLEIRQREEKVVQQLLSQAQIVLCTCVGAASRLLAGLAFDAVVIDEAAQATEAACWIPALLAKQQIVLAGDHCQLPPTVLSDIPEVQKGLSTTLFERVMLLYGETPVDGRISRMLKVQYRMHATIANWASQALYHSALQTHESVRDQTLAHAFPNASADDFLGPLVLLDTAGCDLHDSTNVDGSRYNPGEGQLVCAHVRKLLALGLRADQIAVITPYNGQVELLKSIVLPEHPTLPIRSVDGFQGGEREAVIISLVRSSVGGREGIGFLRDDRRLNVAVTRAQRHCCIIGDSETVSHSPFIRNLLDWIETHGEVHSAVEVLSDIDNDVNERDMAQAEIILQQLIDQTDAQHPTSSHTQSASKRPSSVEPKSDVDLDVRRQTLSARIQTFQANSQPGDKMTFGSELSRLDRKLVHEIAEELKLEHASGGREGVNRRIAISIPIKSNTEYSKVLSVISSDSVVMDPVASVDSVEAVEDDTVNVVTDDNDVDEEATAVVPFASQALVALDVDDEVGSHRDTGNDLLRSLAIERAEREKQKQPPNTKKNKKKGQKSGGASRPSHPANIVPAGDMDSDDEIAFLDAQIATVQNSHGRRVEGAGPGYRTIINGILLAQPKPVTKNTNAKATNALNAKLKAAQESRKAQAKKK